VFNLVIGIVIGMPTPPAGVVVCGVTGIGMGRMMRHLRPFVGLMYALLVACMLYPPIVTWLPRAVGYWARGRATAGFAA